MYKRYSIILIIILVWLLQNSFAGLSFGGCCQQEDTTCNCSKDQTISCNKTSEGHCDVTCIKGIPLTSPLDESKINRTFRNIHVDTTGIVPILDLHFLFTSNNCPEYINVIMQPCLYLGQSHYRSPPIV